MLILRRVQYNFQNNCSFYSFSSADCSAWRLRDQINQRVELFWAKPYYDCMYSIAQCTNKSKSVPRTGHSPHSTDVKAGISVRPFNYIGTSPHFRLSLNMNIYFGQAFSNLVYRAMDKNNYSHRATKRPKVWPTMLEMRALSIVGYTDYHLFENNRRDC